MKRKKIGIITICVLLFLGAMIFIVIRLSLIHISEPTRRS